jgi:hypothetical protein
MKHFLIALVALYMAFESKAMVPPSLSILSSDPVVREETSNIEHLRNLSHYLIKVRTLQLIEVDGTVKFEDVWVPYEVPFSHLAKRKDKYLLFLPVNLEISYRNENICGEEVEGAGYIRVMLPQGSDKSTVEVKYYGVKVQDLETYGSHSIESVPVISSCFE